MIEKPQAYEIIFAHEDDEAMLLMATIIINTYAQQGIMLSVTIEQLQQIASQGLLALAITSDEAVIGSAGITFEYPDGKNEFGGWAVQHEWIKAGVGKKLLESVLKKVSKKTVIAFANNNSGPIFRKLGAKVIDQRTMHPSAFEPCKACLCKGKDSLPDGQYCVDQIFDLGPIIENSESRLLSDD